MRFTFVHLGGQEVTVEALDDAAAWPALKETLGSQAPVTKLMQAWGLKVERPPDTSREAYESVDHGSVQDRILAYVEARSGATTDEIEVALDMIHQTCSASVNALVKRGVLRYSDKTRPTRSGRQARIVEVA